jgi:hypothetical protein
MNHDDSSKKPEETQDETATPADPAAPRRIMLGKRVLRHFHVKSGVRTGIISIVDNGSTRCHTRVS